MFDAELLRRLCRDLTAEKDQQDRKSCRHCYAQWSTTMRKRFQRYGAGCPRDIRHPARNAHSRSQTGGARGDCPQAEMCLRDCAGHLPYSGLAGIGRLLSLATRARLLAQVQMSLRSETSAGSTL